METKDLSPIEYVGFWGEIYGMESMLFEAQPVWKIMVIASTREEANVKAFAALGKATNGYHWVIKWGSIKECPHLEGADAQPST